MSAELNTPGSVERPEMMTRKLILSVDDEPGILSSRQLILETAGYDVVNASDGAQALGIFSTVLVDLVVLDYSMPGVNGGEVAKVFKTRRPELPILIVSGRPVEEEVFLCVDGFLVKGESPGLMLQKIEQLLSTPASVRLPDGMKTRTDGDGRTPLWAELARLAKTEQDPETQMALVAEINRLVEKRDRMVKDSAAKLARTEINRMIEMKPPFPNDGSNNTDSK